MLQSVNGCRIHYEIRHNSKSILPPILFLHGWGCDSNIYAQSMAAMQDQATLITLDFPAHGMSDEPPQPWGVEDFAMQVLQLLDDLHIQKVQIVAHSFGGRIAIWLGSQVPDRVDKIVITGGAGIKKPQTQQANQRTAHYKRMRAMADRLMKVPLLKTPMEKANEHLVQKYGSPDYAKLSDGMRKTFVKIVAEDLTPMLQQITAPVLLIWGSEDTETPLWMGKTMEQDIPDAGLVIFSGRSHFAFLEESDRFILIVKQFFQGGTAQ